MAEENDYELEWVTNAPVISHDRNSKFYKRYEVYFKDEQSFEQHLKFYKDFIVGEPIPANMEGAFTLEELKRIGYVGYYRRKENG